MKLLPIKMVYPTVIRRRLGALEKLYSGNLYTFYLSLSKGISEVVIGDIACFP
jgi:hypothetical protein